MKQHKYKAQRTVIKGLSFPSKLEASVYNILQLRQKSGEIVDITRQPRVTLVAGIKWFVDFVCELKDGSSLYVEAKGIDTEGYLLKKKLWAVFGPAPLEVWKGSWAKPYLDETVIPKHE